MAKLLSDEIDLARLRAYVRKKPRTKAGQVRQSWPEIRALRNAGHTLKDVCAWLNECGLEIGYARLSDYVNKLRRSQPETMERTAPERAVPVTCGATEEPQQPIAVKALDSLANVRAGDAKRPGFHYRAVMPGDEKDLI